jgi:hypothetical protein
MAISRDDSKLDIFTSPSHFSAISAIHFTNLALGSARHLCENLSGRIYSSLHTSWQCAKGRQSVARRYPIAPVRICAILSYLITSPRPRTLEAAKLWPWPLARIIPSSSLKSIQTISRRCIIGMMHPKVMLETGRTMSSSIKSHDQGFRVILRNNRCKASPRDCFIRKSL